MTFRRRGGLLALLISAGIGNALARTDPAPLQPATRAGARAEAAGALPGTPGAPSRPSTAGAPVAVVAEPPLVDLHAAPALSDELIRKAVRATVAEDPHPLDTAARNAAAYGAATLTSQERMTQAFNQGKVPDCLHADALKLQPAFIGPFAVVGPLSLPWLVTAALRGKCR